MRAPDENSQRDNEFGREPDPEYDAATAQRDYDILRRNKLKREALEEMFPDPVERMQYCMRLYAQQNEGRNLAVAPDEPDEDDMMQAQREAYLDAMNTRQKKKTPVSGIIDTLKGKRGPLAWLLGMTAIPLAGAAIVTAFTFGSPVAIGAYAAYAAGCAVCSRMVGYENPNRKQEYMMKALKGALITFAVGRFITQKLFNLTKKLVKTALFLGVIGAGVLALGGIAGAVAGPAVGAGVIIAGGFIGAMAGLVKLISLGARKEPQMPQQAPQQMQQGYAPVGQQRSVRQDYNNVATNDNSDALRRQQVNDDATRLQRNEFLGSGGQSGAPTFS